MLKIDIINFGTKEYAKDITLQEIANDLSLQEKTIVANINNDVKSLYHKVKKDSTVEFLDITSENGFRSYQKSACMILVMAIKKVLGKEVDIKIEHSIKKNYYCEFLDENINVTDELLSTIKTEMLNIVKQNFPIEKVEISFDEMKEYAAAHKMNNVSLLLKYRHSSQLSMYKIDDFYDYYLGIMAPTTGFIEVFNLVKAYDGFMLELPSKVDPSVVLDYKPVENISQVFRDYSAWTKILKIETVGALNSIISNGEIGEIIRISEALHEKKVAEIADMIHKRKDARLILIAGPTSSGKTTFSKRLSTQLRVNGLKVQMLSVDNYFISRADTPLDEYGNRNYETIEAIDLELFNDNLKRLLEGEEVLMPTYNFIDGVKEYKGNSLRLDDDELIIVEGIHALNSEMTSPIDESIKFHIFISALTQLNLDSHNRISTTDTRIVRRIVRDNQYRGTSPEETINMWASVTRGEAENIFPYQERADIIFNSALLYELCVLKQFIEPLLFRIDVSMPQYSEAKRLIKLFDCFLTVPTKDIPNNSILREFIGDSCFRT